MLCSTHQDTQNSHFFYQCSPILLRVSKIDTNIGETLSSELNNKGHLSSEFNTSSAAIGLIPVPPASNTDFNSSGKTRQQILGSFEDIVNDCSEDVKKTSNQLEVVCSFIR
ncbi:hypothetical protein GE061_005356 [Apolygus lucorum]|uniref:Uncharacterized protein n=1 Tax=Apolygus lucorum TaxID=248454 RepID=A0A8S9WXF5_APOLU|nr:hypothetical protein GE061_005356 [Apolygus lucorum]